MRVPFFLLCSAASLYAASEAFAEQPGSLSVDDVLNMSLAELSSQEVTSVSKKAEKANEAAAAVYVINQEDIRRSGATSIPEALRMAPGISVAQSGSHDWAVTSRGFNDQFANKLLVLMDGRTVYSPLFSGVLWELQDTMLEDIERIEVIRGPGATVWGANAVNGVINIITKNAKDTQGGVASFSAGNIERGAAATRYGAKIGEDSYFRAYAKYNNRDEQYAIGGGRSGDGWSKRQAGFRTDAAPSSDSSLTVQGDLYKTDEDLNHIFPSLSAPYTTTVNDATNASGGNVLTRFTKNINPDSSIATQFYIDNTQYKTSHISYNTTTLDFDAQHTWTGWRRQEVIWGAGYRAIMDHSRASTLFALTPQDNTDNLYSAFLQDKITLNPNDVFLTLGSKFERNDYSGYEVQPSARLSWLISDTQMAWGSVSRAVHTPSRFTEEGQLALGVLPPTLTLPIPVLVSSAGNPGLDSEELIAYELGYRLQPTDSISVDTAAFYNDYDKLFLGTLGAATIPGPYVYQPVIAQNTEKARSFGFELSTKVDVSRIWQLSANYSYINTVFDTKSDGSGQAFIGKHPKNQYGLRSVYLFPKNIEMNNALYYVGRLNGPLASIPGYYRFDSRLSYPITERMEVSLTGQNLLRSKHKEFGPFVYQQQTAIGRSVYANLSIKF